VKKLILTCLVVAMAASVFVIPAQAQEADRSSSKGWGAGIILFDGEFGLQARKDFWLGGDVSQITGQAGFIFAGDGFLDLSLDYHFVIKTESGKSRWYPLAGLNLKTDFDNSEFGVNAGGGVNFMMTEKLAAYAEVKYVFSDWDELGFALGIYF
jgi:opacity protein-like surface antigen